MMKLDRDLRLVQREFIIHFGGIMRFKYKTIPQKRVGRLPKISMSLLLAYGCTSASSTHTHSNVELPPEDARKMTALVDRLELIPVAGPTGGPYRGIDGNLVTDAIIAQGSPIIPFLMHAIDTSDWAETTYIVYCLRKLHAKSAGDRIRRLELENESGKRFGASAEDMSLTMQIRFFLEAWPSW